MYKLEDIQPYVGTAHTFLYNGGITEDIRRGSCYALHLFIDGTGYMMLENQKFLVGKGTLIFLQPGKAHSFHSNSGEPLFTYNIYFDLWEDNQFKSVIPQLSYASNPFIFESSTLVYPCDELDKLPACSSLLPYPYLVDQFIHTVKLFSDNSYYQEKTTNSFFYAWMLQWFDAQNSPHQMDPRIAIIIELMESYPERHPSYGELCEKSGLEKSYFYKLFKKETGMNPKDFLIKTRMKRAAIILKESSQSITSISDMLGYLSIHYFTRQFTAFYGMNPSQFRIGQRKQQ